MNTQQFPEPRLLRHLTQTGLDNRFVGEPGEMTKFLEQESAALTAQPWQDEQGNVHLPIDQAMKPVVSRLPVRAGGSGAAELSRRGAGVLLSAARSRSRAGPGRAMPAGEAREPGETGEFFRRQVGGQQPRQLRGDTDDDVGNGTIRKLALSLTLASALVSTLCGVASAQYFTPPDTKTVAPPGLEGVGIDQRLNEQVPLNLTFKDEQGKTVRLGDYFHDGRPVILNLVYYQCPMLCTEVLNGLTAALKVIGFVPGKQFEIVTLSIDPRETPQLAANKKECT